MGLYGNEKIFLMLIKDKNIYSVSHENSKTNYEKLTILIDNFLKAHKVKINEISRELEDQGEKIFNFVMEDLDPNTTSKINSGETIQIEYFGNVTMVYLGMDLSPTKTDIPVGVFIIE